ncbi:MAG: M28 family peptidase [Gemmatimonadetes bacterium]|nr:M28 family peptidase [Gemmatimonadota bacterium]
MVLPRRPRSLWGALACVLLLTSCSSGAARTQARGIQLDSAALLRRVEVLAADSMEGRETGTPGNARARRYLLRELTRIGLEPIGGSYEHPFEISGRAGATSGRGVNLIGKFTGTRFPQRYLVLTAHYDHVGIGRPVQGDSIYNGADDNASGVAALLAIAEHFRREAPQATLLLALLDAEEIGLHGAVRLVQSPPVPIDSVLANVNLDMVSHSARGELYAAGPGRYPFLRPILERVAARASIRLLFGHDRPGAGEGYDWTLQSDHAAFHRAGIPFVYFGVEDHPDYHKPSDEARSITPAFFVAATRTLIDAVRALDGQVEELARHRR